MAPKRRPAKKIYVSVNSFFDTTGYMRPTSILWPDGRVFPIEQIRDYRPAEPSDSFFGDCYTIIIRGQEKFQSSVVLAAGCSSARQSYCRFVVPLL